VDEAGWGEVAAGSREDRDGGNEVERSFLAQRIAGLKSPG
jgi:hypothetical protein